MKRINTLIIALGMAMSFSIAPAFAAPAETELMSVAAPDGQEVSISVSGNVIRVAGAAKQTLVVYYVTGTRASTCLRLARWCVRFPFHSYKLHNHIAESNWAKFS